MTACRTTQCPACGAESMREFVHIDQAAVLANVLWDDRRSAVNAPRAAISLGVCGECGMMFNMDFDPSLLAYAQGYENALDYSPRFRQYARDLANRLVRTYGLYRKDVVEIGCGQGKFLALLAMLGDNRATGYDPSHDPRRAEEETKDVTEILPESFRGEQVRGSADLICCRHVLEHIPDPYSFLCSVRAGLKHHDRAAVYMEVPNGLHMLREMSIWDIIYEHCSYFTPSSLSRLFVRAGFEPLAVTEQFGGQFLCIEARPARSAAPTESGRWARPVDFGAMVDRFGQSHDVKIAQWRSALAELADRSARTVIWGAGSKGITFLNAVDSPVGPIEYAVDLNPHKQGRFLTGSGQEVVAPVFMADYRPAAVIIMNPIYAHEISASLAEMNLASEVLTA